MYSALDVAKFVINKSSQIEDYSFSNLKLQNLLYIIQSYYIKQFGYPCFSDNMEAWGFGPVVPSVYRLFEFFGSGTLPPVKYIIRTYKNFNRNTSNLITTSSLSQKDRGIITHILWHYKNTNNTNLGDITLNDNAYLFAYSSEKRIITPEIIKEHGNLF
jgi:uncharacterized phage-associated protein